MKKAVLIAVAILVAPLTLSGQEVRGAKDRDVPSMQGSPKGAEPAERADERPETPFKDRVAEAIERVEDACAGDIDDFCSKVSAGEGRIALCMLAHEDALSYRCKFGLYRAARKLKSEVSQGAEACLREIQTLCGETGRIRQCLEQKRGSLSSSCQTVIGVVGQRVRRLTGLLGTDVYSSDNKNLGQVVDVTKGPDDRIQSIQVDIGRILGLGSKMVTITADKLEHMPGIKVLLSEKDARSLPEAKKQ